MPKNENHASTIPRAISAPVLPEKVCCIFEYIMCKKKELFQLDLCIDRIIVFLKKITRTEFAKNSF